MLPKLKNDRHPLEGYVAIVLAAGIGQRLGPLGQNRPKALLKFLNVSLLELRLDHLIKLGCRKIVVNAHHLWWQIKACIEQEKYLGLVELSLEKNLLLGTAGALGKIHAKYQSESYLVINADIVSDFPVLDLVAEHEGSGALASMALLPAPHLEEQPVWCKDDWICGFAHDCAADANLRPQGFACLQALSARFVEAIAPVPSSVITFYRQAITKGEKIRAVTRSALWWDLGSPKRYAKAHFEFLKICQENPEKASTYLDAIGFSEDNRPKLILSDKVEGCEPYCINNDLSRRLVSEGLNLDLASFI